jgi:hypothetical protein
MRILAEILFYAIVVVTLAYVARHYEGFSVGRIQSDVPSFVKMLKQFLS